MDYTRVFWHPKIYKLYGTVADSLVLSKQESKEAVEIQGITFSSRWRQKQLSTSSGANSFDSLLESRLLKKFLMLTLINLE